MNTNQKAQELAQSVSAFISHNEIDIKEYTMEEIVSAYFQAQIQSAEDAGKELLKQI